MIRIRTAAGRQQLEEIANQMAAEGFRMTMLAFRGIEAWAVFEPVPVVEVSGPAMDQAITAQVVERMVYNDADGKVSPVAIKVESRPAQNSFKRRGR